jgi:glycosyltransferase involved in cell wall biosynthesis
MMTVGAPAMTSRRQRFAKTRTGGVNPAGRRTHGGYAIQAIMPSSAQSQTAATPDTLAPEPGGTSPPPAPHDYAAESQVLAQFFNFTRDDIAASLADCRAEATRPLVNRIAWFIPHAPSTFAGGIHTVLRMADYLRSMAGMDQVLCVTGAPGVDAARARIAEAYPALAAAAEIVVLDRIDQAPALGAADAAIATLWVTALPVLLLRQVRRKLYLLQDWEPEFYPAGSTSVLVEASYRFGFHAVCGSASLAEAYRELGGTAEHFGYAADPAIFHARRPIRDPAEPKRLFCYGRPTHPRNCYELAAAALRDIKKHYGANIDIVLAGGDWDPATHNLAGIARNLGLVPHERMADIYRACDVALCFTASRNPSIVMLELLACGTPVVTLHNRCHAWLPRGNDILFECEASRSEIAATVRHVLEQHTVREAHVARGLALIQRKFSDWSRAGALIARAVVQPAGRPFGAAAVRRLWGRLTPRPASPAARISEPPAAPVAATEYARAPHAPPPPGSPDHPASESPSRR